MPRKENTVNRNTIRESVREPEPETPPRKENGAKKSKASGTASKQPSRPFATLIATLKSDKFQKVSGLFILLFSLYLGAAFISYLFTWKADDNIFFNSVGRVLLDNDLQSENWMGKIGAVLAYLFIKKWFGLASFFIVVLLFIGGLRLFLNLKVFPFRKALAYTVFGLIWLSLTLSFFMPGSDLIILGGVVGYQLKIWLSSIIGKTGTGFLIFFTLLSFLIIEYNIHRRWQRRKRTQDIPDQNSDPGRMGNTLVTDTDINQSNAEPEPEEGQYGDDFEVFSKDSQPETIDTSFGESVPLQNSFPEDPVPDSGQVPFTIENNEPEEIYNEEPDATREGTGHQTIDTEYDPTLDLPDYKFPGLDLLREYDSGNVAVQNEELEANKNRILKTLNNYSIQIDKINATIGPTVTLYEIVPAPGIRISKIKNLEDDIALSLSALGIRIIAPMPGKGTIGIEVPNQNPRTVSMKSILASDAFQNSGFELPIGLGKTISNKSYVADLAKMPHMLVAGATGQGKSVGLNAIITSLLYKKHPSQLKFVLVDPKKVELTLFSKIERHYLAKLPDSEEAIITDVRKVVRTLNSLCIEMDARYDLLKFANVRNIKEYNAKFVARKLNPNDGHHYLPYIVLIVDEFADLILTAGKEVEGPVARIAQLARAVGIHLIVATQRPSVNVITGTIKANFPARIAYRVISKIDSRTILDTGGADQLIGRGDMLMSLGSEMLRLQCAFIDTPEVEEITDFIGNQRAYPEAFMLPECPDEESEAAKNLDPSERDEFFDEAARVVVSHQHGSTSLIQRKLKLGYNRAGRIIDQLEAAGIVGPFEGSKARDVRIKDMDSLEQFLKSLRNNL